MGPVIKNKSLHMGRTAAATVEERWVDKLIAKNYIDRETIETKKIVKLILSNKIKIIVCWPFNF